MSTKLRVAALVAVCAAAALAAQAWGSGPPKVTDYRQCPIVSTSRLTAYTGRPSWHMFVLSLQNSRYWSCSLGNSHADVGIGVACGTAPEDTTEFQAGVILQAPGIHGGVRLINLGLYGVYLVSARLEGVIGVMGADRQIYVSGSTGHGLDKTGSPQKKGARPMSAAQLLPLARAGLRFDCSRKS